MVKGISETRGVEENGEIMFNGDRVAVLQDEKVLDIYCITMEIYLTVLTRAL